MLASASSKPQYLVDPPKKLLPALLDFDLVNSGKTRFTLGLTTVQTGQMRYFDNKQERIGLEHVLGSSALPPCFPAVLINGEYYWDGGVYSNSPIEVVFDEYQRESSVVFAIQIWHTRGPRPEPLSHAFMREKNILFGSRSKTHIMRQAQLHRMRRIIRELGDMLPEEQKALSASQGTCRLELHNDHASGGDQRTADQRRDQRQRLRFLPRGSAIPVAGGLRGH
jgi:NTE family protein